MSTGIRRKIGMALVAVSVVAAIIVFVGTEKSGDVRIVSQRDLGNFHEAVVAADVTVHWRWLAPTLALLVVGLAFLVWPSRKPPRLIS
jgi:hypothetical protein